VLTCYVENRYIGLGKLFIKLIRRKNVKIVAIRCYVLKLKCTSAPTDPLAGFNGVLLLRVGRRGWRGRNGLEKEGRRMGRVESGWE